MAGDGPSSTTSTRAPKKVVDADLRRHDVIGWSEDQSFRGLVLGQWNSEVEVPHNAIRTLPNASSATVAPRGTRHVASYSWMISGPDRGADKPARSTTGVSIHPASANQARRLAGTSAAAGGMCDGRRGRSGVPRLRIILNSARAVARAAKQQLSAATSQGSNDDDHPVDWSKDRPHPVVEDADRLVIGNRVCPFFIICCCCFFHRLIIIVRDSGGDGSGCYCYGSRCW